MKDSNLNGNFYSNHTTNQQNEASLYINYPSNNNNLYQNEASQYVNDPSNNNNLYQNQQTEIPVPISQISDTNIYDQIGTNAAQNYDALDRAESRNENANVEENRGLPSSATININENPDNFTDLKLVINKINS